MRQPRSPKGNCATPECWQTARCAGFCGACYQAVRRLVTLTVPEVAIYLKRTRRFTSRATGVLRKRSKGWRAA